MAVSLSHTNQQSEDEEQIKNKSSNKMGKKNQKHDSKNNNNNNKKKTEVVTHHTKNVKLTKPQKSPHHTSSAPTASSASSNQTNTTKPGGMSQLQVQFMKKLEGARFRTINEELYTSTGERSFEAFQSEPEKFFTYHKGYREQAQAWPCNPLDNLINWIKTRHPRAVVADMGCGEARLAASVPSSNVVHSFDLVAANETVTACDMAAVPLPDASVDIVVFCLSLMGKNLNDFIREASRLLKPNGILKIVEVRSRFEDNKGIKKFIQFLKSAGFRVSIEDEFQDNRMFFSVEALKSTQSPNFQMNFELKPCQYKKR
jgi:ribosomal RNA-processing protein 8